MPSENQTSRPSRLIVPYDSKDKARWVKMADGRPLAEWVIETLNEKAKKIELMKTPKKSKEGCAKERLLFKSINYAQPTSHTAKGYDRSEQGCYVVRVGGYMHPGAKEWGPFDSFKAASIFAESLPNPFSKYSLKP